MTQLIIEIREHRFLHTSFNKKPLNNYELIKYIYYVKVFLTVNVLHLLYWHIHKTFTKIIVLIILTY